MAISAKELPKNHTDKERFAVASSFIATEILTLLFARKRRRSTVPVLYQPPRSRSRRVSDLKVPIDCLKRHQVHLRLPQSKQCTSWTSLNDAMAISAKESPKNHTDKERFAAASSCIATEIFTFRAQTTAFYRSSPLSATAF